jgi:hypothetical protein
MPDYVINEDHVYLDPLHRGTLSRIPGAMPHMFSSRADFA